MNTLRLSIIVAGISLAVFTQQASAELNTHSSRYQQYMESLRIMPAGMDKNDLKVYLMTEYLEIYSYFRELSKEHQDALYQYYLEQEETEIADFDSKLREYI